jgi:hypothetical protein
MKHHAAALAAGLLGAAAISAAESRLPIDKVYGVNVSVTVPFFRSLF